MERRALLRGGGAVLASVGALRLAYNEHRLYQMRENGHTAYPRHQGLSSATLMWKAETDRPVVALTFDDGPDPRYTPEVLDALARHEVPATFFLQGRHVDRHPDLARRVAEEHTVGNHTYSHRSLANASTSTARDQMERAHQAIFDVTGTEPHIFRPPYGHLSGAANLQAAQLGYDTVLWSQRVDSRSPADDNVERLSGRMGPGDVILAHDGGSMDNTSVVECLPDLLVMLDDQGFEHVSVPEMMAIAAGSDLG